VSNTDVAPGELLTTMGWLRLSPEEIDNPYLFTPERDLWHVGVVMIQMLFGSESIIRYDSLRRILEDGTLTDSRIDRRQWLTSCYCFIEDAPHKSTLEVLHGLLHKHAKRRITAKHGAILLTRQDVESSASPSVFSGESFFSSPKAVH
jgi:hypothetical protein